MPSLSRHLSLELKNKRDSSTSLRSARHDTGALVLHYLCRRQLVRVWVAHSSFAIRSFVIGHLGSLAPYLERERRRSLTPAASRGPRMMW